MSVSRCPEYLFSGAQGAAQIQPMAVNVEDETELEGGMDTCPAVLVGRGVLCDSVAGYLDKIDQKLISYLERTRVLT